jgi:hypothetical protein
MSSDPFAYSRGARSGSGAAQAEWQNFPQQHAPPASAGFAPIPAPAAPFDNARGSGAPGRHFAPAPAAGGAGSGGSSGVRGGFGAPDPYAASLATMARCVAYQFTHLK